MSATKVIYRRNGTTRVAISCDCGHTYTIQEFGPGSGLFSSKFDFCPSCDRPTQATATAAYIEEN